MDPHTIVALISFALPFPIFGYARFVQWRLERAEDLAVHKREDDEFWNPDSDTPLFDWLVSLRFDEELDALPETEDVDR